MRDTSHQEDSGCDGEEVAPGFALISTYKFTFQMSGVPFKEVISPSQELSWVYGVSNPLRRLRTSYH